MSTEPVRESEHDPENVSPETAALIAKRLAKLERKVKVGDRIRDNDPRMYDRVLTVESLTMGSPHCYAECRNGSMRTRIRLSRIYTDGKRRKSGFSLVGGGR